MSARVVKAVDVKCASTLQFIDGSNAGTISLTMIEFQHVPVNF